MVFEIVEKNFIVVVIASFLILFVCTNNNFIKRTNRLFLASALCILILTVEEAWEAKLALMQTPVMLRTVLSAIGYSLRPMIPYFLILIVQKCSRAQFVALSIPLVCNTLVAFSALFCKVSFGYTANNNFVRGPLGIMPFLVAAFYVGILLIQTTQEWRKGGFKEALIVTAIVLVAFLSTLMESLFGFQFIQNPCMATSITFYYLFLNSNQNNRDPLTGALTRRRFYLDADKYHTVMTAVISMDLNNLKMLNDQYGHMEGDKALVTVTNVVKRYMGRHASFYRTGGDEFMILCYRMGEEAIQNMIGKIRKDFENTKYRCAIGYAICSQQFNFDLVCQTADRIMYENKRQMKSNQQIGSV